ncbi:MAG: tRNA uridine-5-carboxymethylaminomethyl(34) synthesis GTPase MnmE [Clostridia bacterium]|nr:tRNA uridine-5-carboxymethylaminomethyl(34) synthesis GTPase MnmE [Clostridia bacterium]
MLNDMIAAISTPIGKGGVALVRVSGNGCHQAVEKIFFPMSKKRLTDYSPRFAVYGEIRDERSLIDTAIVTRFSSPHSFTGEDMVEISCHGGYVVSSMVLEAVLSLGIRMAEAGEFTRRAFINDKLSLTEAEAIGDVLSAVSREGVRLSSSQASGVLSARMKEITDKLTSLISSIYAYIDYPDEDLEDVDDETLGIALEDLIVDCETLLSTYRAGNAITHGIPTVIVGKPNVGKSSLFNSLIHEDRAIVTDIPGTTRDMLEYTADVKGVTLRLVDTAGLRESTEDAIEEMGMDIARARLLSPETSLVLALFDLSRALDGDDERLIEALATINDKTVIPVYTKCDLDVLLDVDKIEKALGEGVTVSSRDGKGLEALEERIFSAFIGEELPQPESPMLTGVRQRSVVERGLDGLRQAKTELETGFKDMTGMTLESALASLLEVDARGVGEHIVDEIFSKFCVGK